jgi:hypothetical protein
MYPKFTVNTRSYSITLKMKNPLTNEISEIVAATTYDYGTSIETILESAPIPYVDSSNLNLLEGYDFKGYSLVEGSSTLISSSYQVTGDAVLWAVFKLENNIRNVVHPEWFTISLDSSGEICTITPKYKLGGKVTLPSKDKNTNTFITNIGVFSNCSLTHVFLENDNQIRVINANAFAKSDTDTEYPSLRYFDFTNAKELRAIYYRAFRECHLLESFDFSNTKLSSIGDGAFN